MIHRLSKRWSVRASLRDDPEEIFFWVYARQVVRRRVRLPAREARVARDGEERRVLAVVHRSHLDELEPVRRRPLARRTVKRSVERMRNPPRLLCATDLVEAEGELLHRPRAYCVLESAVHGGHRALKTRGARKRSGSIPQLSAMETSEAPCPVAPSEDGRDERQASTKAGHVEAQPSTRLVWKVPLNGRQLASKTRGASRLDVRFVHLPPGLHRPRIVGS